MTALSEKLERVLGVAQAALIFGAAVAVLCFSQAVQAAVRNSISYCLTVLVPSLFPFMVITNFSVNSRVCGVLSRRLGWLMRWVFHLPNECAAPVIFGLIGGYPTGAAAAAALLRRGKITEEQAGRLMMFCVSPGIAFSVTFLGGTVLSSYRVGWRLFAAVTIAAVVCGVISGLGAARPKPSKDTEISSEGTLVPAVQAACSAAVKMCAFIVVFAAVMAILHSVEIFQRVVRTMAFFGVPSPDGAVVLSFIAEVTGGVGTAQVFRASVPLYAFGLGFGGLCVHLQLFSFFERPPIKLWKFLSFRVLHGVLAAIIYTVLSRLWPMSEAAANAEISTFGRSASLALSPLGGLSLILMCMAFLLIVGKSADEY